MEVWKLPDVLILHLKRFVYKNLLYSKKIDTFVSYPLSSLNMKPYCCDKSHGDDDYYTYDLYAVPTILVEWVLATIQHMLVIHLKLNSIKRTKNGEILMTLQFLKFQQIK